MTLVVIHVNDGLITNDRIDPPTPLVFEMSEAYPGKYFFQCTSVQGLPYLGYDENTGNFNLTSCPVYAMITKETHENLILERKRFELKTEHKSLGRWYFYVDPTLTQVTRPTEVPKSTISPMVFVVIMVILIILLLVFGLSLQT